MRLREDNRNRPAMPTIQLAPTTEYIKKTAPELAPYDWHVVYNDCETKDRRTNDLFCHRWAGDVGRVSKSSVSLHNLTIRKSNAEIRRA